MPGKRSRLEPRGRGEDLAGDLDVLPGDAHERLAGLDPAADPKVRGAFGPQEVQGRPNGPVGVILVGPGRPEDPEQSVREQSLRARPSVRTILAGPSLPVTAALPRGRILADVATSASSDTGPDGAAGGPSGPRALHGLEASERQLAKFVSAGLSDAEIAGRLALDVGAVQLKLDALLGKLHLRSRTELALLAADGPPDESTWPARAR